MKQLLNGSHMNPYRKSIYTYVLGFSLITVAVIYFFAMEVLNQAINLKYQIEDLFIPSLTLFFQHRIWLWFIALCAGLLSLISSSICLIRGIGGIMAKALFVLMILLLICGLSFVFVFIKDVIFISNDADLLIGRSVPAMDHYQSVFYDPLIIILYAMLGCWVSKKCFK